jgi:integrase
MKLKARTLNGVRIRPEIVKGSPTGKWIADIPAHIAGTKRERLFFDSLAKAEQHVTQRTRDPGRSPQPMFLQQPYGMPQVPGLMPVFPGGYPVPAMPNVQIPSIETLAREWIAYSEQKVALKQKRQASHDTDLYRLAPVRTYFGITAITAIDDDVWGKYLVKRQDTDGMAAGTLQGETGIMRKLLNFAVTKYRPWFHAPKLAGLTVDGDDEERFTQADAAKLIQAVEPRYRHLVWLWAETGLRRSEALSLTWSQIDLQKGTVTVRPVRKLQFRGKTAHSLRTVAISEPLAKLFAAELAHRTAQGTAKPDDFVFVGRSGEKPLANTQRIFARAAQKAGLVDAEGEVRRVSPQRFRKAVATWLMNDPTVPEIEAQAKLGHAPGSTVTRKHYARPDEVRMRRTTINLPVEPLPVTAKTLAVDGSGAETPLPKGV